METRELARRIWEQRKCVQDKHVPPYMLNINHPTVRVLYDRWKERTGRKSYDAPSEIERISFELEVMGPEAVQLLAQHFDTVDRLARTMRGD